MPWVFSLLAFGKAEVPEWVRRGEQRFCGFPLSFGFSTAGWGRRLAQQCSSCQIPHQL